MVKKGMSREEKASVALQFFHDEKSPFTMVELGKLLSKKGITTQTVEETVKGLRDNDLIETDKVGASVLFWSWPGKAVQNSKNKASKLESQIDDIKKRKAELEKQQKQLLADGRADTSERAQKRAKLADMKQQLVQTDAQLHQFSAADPKRVEEMKKAVDVCKSATNRWADNLESCVSFMKNKFGAEEKDIRKQFGLPAEFETY